MKLSSTKMAGRVCRHNETPTHHYNDHHHTETGTRSLVRYSLANGTNRFMASFYDHRRRVEGEVESQRVFRLACHRLQNCYSHRKRCSGRTTFLAAVDQLCSGTIAQFDLPFTTSERMMTAGFATVETVSIEQDFVM